MRKRFNLVRSIIYVFCSVCLTRNRFSWSLFYQANNLWGRISYRIDSKILLNCVRQTVEISFFLSCAYKQYYLQMKSLNQQGGKQINLLTFNVLQNVLRSFVRLTTVLCCFLSLYLLFRVMCGVFVSACYNLSLSLQLLINRFIVFFFKNCPVTICFFLH